MLSTIEWSTNMSHIYAWLLYAPTTCEQIYIEKIKTVFISAEHNQSYDILVSAYKCVESKRPLTIAFWTSNADVSS